MALVKDHDWYLKQWLADKYKLRQPNKMTFIVLKSPVPFLCSIESFEQKTGLQNRNWDSNNSLA
jgi:hypothetical protein